MGSTWFLFCTSGKKKERNSLLQSTLKEMDGGLIFVSFSFLVWSPSEISHAASTMKDDLHFSNDGADRWLQQIWRTMTASCKFWINGGAVFRWRHETECQDPCRKPYFLIFYLLSGDEIWDSFTEDEVDNDENDGDNLLLIFLFFYFFFKG